MSATRIAHAAAGLAALGASVVLLGPVALALWLVPDIPLFAGGLRDGRLNPRAVPAYNAVHALPGPAALTAAGAVAASPFVLGLGVLWISHVALDRSLGYGLRSADGWQRG